MIDPKDIEQGSDAWAEIRLGKVTASQISNVLMKPSLAGYQNYRAQLACERLTGQPTDNYQSADMAYGNETEAQARAFYEMETGNDIDEVGFIEHPTIPMSGSSPDGLIGKDGGLELKCPKPATHIKTLTGGKIARNYNLQMQWNMGCSGRQWWDFASFNVDLPPEMQMFIQRVERDPAMIVEITTAVEAFLADVDALVAQLSSDYPAK